MTGQPAQTTEQPQPQSTNAAKPAEAQATQPAPTEQSTKQDAPAPEQPKPDDTTGKEPVKYELKVPQGIDFPDGAMEALTGRARELGVSPEHVQALLDNAGEAIVKGRDARNDAMRAQWRQQIAADKELGGAKLEENRSLAAIAMKELADEELTDLLDASGLGDHKAMFRLMVKAGRMFREASVIRSEGKGAPSDDERAALRRRYKDSAPAR